MCELPLCATSHNLELRQSVIQNFIHYLGKYTKAQFKKTDVDINWIEQNKHVIWLSYICSFFSNMVLDMLNLNFEFPKKMRSE